MRGKSISTMEDRYPQVADFLEFPAPTCRINGDHHSHHRGLKAILMLSLAMLSLPNLSMAMPSPSALISMVWTPLLLR
jgi:hypothetical protein